VSWVTVTQSCAVIPFPYTGGGRKPIVRILPKITIKSRVSKKESIKRRKKTNLLGTGEKRAKKEKGKLSKFNLGGINEMKQGGKNRGKGQGCLL